MTYVDAFVLSVPKDQLDTYRGILTESAALWKEFGALTYVECLADDVPSRSVRDDGSKRVMSDPRMIKLMENLPVDGDKMIFGGFETMIET